MPHPQNATVSFRLQDLLGGKNVQQFMDDLYATDPWEEGADNLIMANFLSIRLRKCR